MTSFIQLRSLGVASPCDPLATPRFRLSRSLVLGVCCVTAFFTPGLARATYAPPLNNVRIERSAIFHTLNALYASESRATEATSLDFTAWGAQYIGQFEWSEGFGLQVTAGGGGASIAGNLDLEFTRGWTVEAGGWWLGGQVRAYQMLLKTTPDEGERASALTAFINVRGLYYDADDRRRTSRVNLTSAIFTGGIGAMAELSIHDYVSICPYAWLTPGLSSTLRYRAAEQALEASEGTSLRTPFLFGVDVWIYLFPPNWQDHISLSFLASLFDTEDRGDKSLSFVLGYTF